MSKRGTKKDKEVGLPKGGKDVGRRTAKRLPPTKPSSTPDPPDWDYWSSRHLTPVYLEEAVALACNTHPSAAIFPQYWSDPDLGKYGKRLSSARHNADVRGAFRASTFSSGRKVVVLGDFAAWAVRMGARSRLWEDLVPEFRQLVMGAPTMAKVSNSEAAAKTLISALPAPCVAGTLLPTGAEVQNSSVAANPSESELATPLTVDNATTTAVESPTLLSPTPSSQTLSDDDEFDSVRRTNALKIIAGLISKRLGDSGGENLPYAHITALVNKAGYKITSNTVKRYVKEALLLSKDYVG